MNVFAADTQDPNGADIAIVRLSVHASSIRHSIFLSSVSLLTRAARRRVPEEHPHRFLVLDQRKARGGDAAARLPQLGQCAHCRCGWDVIPPWSAHERDHSSHGNSNGDRQQGSRWTSGALGSRSAGQRGGDAGGGGARGFGFVTVGHAAVRGSKWDWHMHFSQYNGSGDV
jgi:uncharacterized membrane protein YgcG